MANLFEVFNPTAFPASKREQFQHSQTRRENSNARHSPVNGVPDQFKPGCDPISDSECPI
jgi:hypothetical protein